MKDVPILNDWALCSLFEEISLRKVRSGTTSKCRKCKMKKAQRNKILLTYNDWKLYLNVVLFVIWHSILINLIQEELNNYDFVFKTEKYLYRKRKYYMYRLYWSWWSSVVYLISLPHIFIARVEFHYFQVVNGYDQLFVLDHVRDTTVNCNCKVVWCINRSNHVLKRRDIGMIWWIGFAIIVTSYAC